MGAAQFDVGGDVEGQSLRTSPRSIPLPLWTQANDSFAYTKVVSGRDVDGVMAPFLLLDERLEPASVRVRMRTYSSRNSEEYPGHDLLPEDQARDMCSCGRVEAQPVRAPRLGTIILAVSSFVFLFK